MAKTKTLRRSAKTGKFVTKQKVKKSPSTTVTEKRKVTKNRSKRK